MENYREIQPYSENYGSNFDLHECHAKSLFYFLIKIDSIKGDTRLPKIFPTMCIKGYICLTEIILALKVCHQCGQNYSYDNNNN